MAIPTTMVWLAIAGVTALGLVVPPVVFRLPPTKRWFRKMDERPLAALNGFALAMGTMVLWPLYLAVIGVIALALASHGTGRWDLLGKVAGLVVCASLVLRVFFAELERITALEMEYKRFQQLAQGRQGAGERAESIGTEV